MKYLIFMIIATNSSFKFSRYKLEIVLGKDKKINQFKSFEMNSIETRENIPYKVLL